MTVEPGEVTLLLRQWKSGSKQAESTLFELLLPDLRRIASHYFARERLGHTLQPTALVNEAFLKLAAVKQVEWRDRGHFLALSARVMRRYLIDHWRSKRSADFMPIDGLPESILANYSQPLELLTALDATLEDLALESPQQRAVVELKFFLGLTDSDAANALNIPLRTLQREWLRARKWLFERLAAKPCKAVTTTTNG